MPKLSVAFGEVIRRERTKKSISQEELAALSDVHRTYMSKIELGKVQLSLEIARKVAAGLGFPLNVLIAEAEELLQLTDTDTGDEVRIGH